jgi:hypothetical protein
VSNEVLEANVINRTAATIGLEHKHLVSIHSVDIVVGDMTDIYTGICQRKAVANYR